MKIFLDANIFIAATGSETGGSRYIFHIAQKDEKIHLVTTRYVLEEASRNIKKKMNNKYSFFSSLITSGIFTVVEEPPMKLIQEVQKVIKEKDAPVLAGAVFAGADILCTLDREDFFTKKVENWCKKLGIKLLIPGEFLEDWRKHH